MDGILLIDKPKGWTSHDVVGKIRNTLQKAQRLGLTNVDAAQGDNENRANRTKRYDERDSQANDAVMRHEPAGATSFAGRQGEAVRKIRVGHAGTLDPMATGLLILLIGSATKQQDRFMKQDKVYEAELTLGAISTTEDAEGELTKISDRKPSEAAVKKALGSFIGEIEQVPPQYSALKLAGQTAYKVARKGGKLELKARKVTVYDIKFESYSYPKLLFTVKVSSGTYIRSLARDIGEDLGVGAYLTALRRTQIGEFGIKEAISPELTPEEIKRAIKPIS